MVGLLQIVIYLMCAHLAYKGAEIFQIAFVAPFSKSRNIGMALGVLAVMVALAVGVGAVFVTESLVAQITDTMPKFPR